MAVTCRARVPFHVDMGNKGGLNVILDKMSFLMAKIVGESREKLSQKHCESLALLTGKRIQNNRKVRPVFRRT